MQRVFEKRGEKVKPTERNTRWWNLFNRPKKKIEVTIETKKTLKMSRLKTQFAQYCPSCGEDTFFLSFDEAQSVFRGDIQNLKAVVESEKLHVTQKQGTGKQICFNSLKNEIEKFSD